MVHPVCNTKLWPLEPRAAGSGRQPATRIDHGPMAMTTASPSTISPLASATPRTAPLGLRTKSTTVPWRSTAPCASAACTRPVVNAQGSTSAVVSGEPSRLGTSRAAPGQPRPPGRTTRGIVLNGVAAVGRQTPITPRIAELGGKLGMELEAPPRQAIERAAAAPVARQKAPRLARGRAGDGVTLYDRRPPA